jgi:hypothetical protein
LQDLISERFGESGFQVLVIVPKGYGEAMRSMQDQIKARSEGSEAGDTQIARGSSHRCSFATARMTNRMSRLDEFKKRCELGRRRPTTQF